MKIAVTIALVAFLTPVAGYISNGFGYVTNRWSWGVCFLIAYIFAEMWPDLFHMSKKDLIYLEVCLMIYFIVCLLMYYDVPENFLYSFSIVTMALFVLAENQGRTVKIMFFFLIIASIGGMAFYKYSTREGNLVGEFIEAKWFQEEFGASEAAAVEAVNVSEDFYRYSGTSMSYNTSIFNGQSNTQFYWSLSNGAVNDFYDDNLIELRDSFNQNGFDSRTIPEEICSTKYFVTTSNTQKVPYGYEFVSSIGVSKPSGAAVYYVYENQYALPLGYTCSSYISEEQAQSLTPLERQEAMSQAVILAEQSNTELDELSFKSTEIDYEIDPNTSVSMQGNSFTTTGRGHQVILTFSGLPDCETYLAIKNLCFSGTTEYELYGSDETADPLNLYGEREWGSLSGQEQRRIRTESRRYIEPYILFFVVEVKHEDGSTDITQYVHETSKYQWYNGRTDVLINLYYSESPAVSIKIWFPERGIYVFDSMEVLCQPMSAYAEEVAALSENVLENLNLHENEVYATNYVTGSIHLEEPKILFLSIPYSSGWEACVDGEKAKIIKANSGFMALMLDIGEHEIELFYHTPGMKAGIYISTITAIVMIIGMLRKILCKKAGTCGLIL